MQFELLSKWSSRMLTLVIQNGKTYNKWYGYGQSKTANMLMAISLAEKLAVKHNLLAFSLHPGVIWTNLADHLNMETEFDGLRKYRKLHPSVRSTH